MIDLDDILQKRGITYDELSSDEKETYHQMMEALSKGDLSLNRVKESIEAMREKVTSLLVEEPEYHQVFIFKVRNLTNLYLKARLKNYIMIEALLTSPEKAQRYVEQQLGAMIDAKDIK